MPKVFFFFFLMQKFWPSWLNVYLGKKCVLFWCCPTPDLIGSQNVFLYSYFYKSKKSVNSYLYKSMKQKNVVILVNSFLFPFVCFYKCVYMYLTTKLKITVQLSKKTVYLTWLSHLAHEEYGAGFIKLLNFL